MSQRKIRYAWIAAFVSAALLARTAEPIVQHRLLLFEYGKGPNRMIELNPVGKVTWEHTPPSIAVLGI